MESNILVKLYAVLVLASVPSISLGQDSTVYHLKKYMVAAGNMGFNGNVLVAMKGKIIYQNAFGYSNLETKTRLDNNSVFTIASVSKQFTAMSIMLLMERNKLKLTDSLRQYFPELPYHNVTIANMLTHTSGLPEYQLMMVHNWDHFKIAHNGDVIKMLADKKPPVFFKPGQHYRYCNTGYVLLASIVEKVSGQSFIDFVADNVFKPLHMRSSRVYSARGEHKDTITDYAYGYFYSDSTKKYERPGRVGFYHLVYYLSGLEGDGSVATTTGDLLKWDRAIKDHTLLKRADQDSMLAPHVLYDTLSKAYYAFGVAVGKNELDNYITHEGIWPGYRACLTRYTGHDITIVVLSNNESNAVGTSRALSFIAFNREVIPPYQHKEISLDPAMLMPYVGIYLTPAPVEFIVRDDKLYRHRTGTADIELKPESPTKFFYADASDRQVEFEKDSGGHVINVWLIANGIRSPLVKQSP
jgi:CubicO group peptidase (beta-lactamase class C family)